MKILSQVSVTLLALLVGGMVLIAFGLVPYWRSLEPADFATAFAASLPTVGGTMIVLTVIGTSSIALAAGFACWKKLPTRNGLLAGAAGAFIMLATVPIYFGAANPLLAGGTLSPAETTAELAKWQQMHWFRTTFGVLGLFFAIRASYPTSSSAQ